MNDSPDASTPLPGTQIRSGFPNPPVNTRSLCLALGALTVVFSLPLYRLVQLALHSELYSHVILIPFISLYLVWMRRGELPPATPPDRRLAILPMIGGVSLLVIGVASHLKPVDAVSLSTLAYVVLIFGVCTLFLCPKTLRALAFPLGFLLFMAPFPTAVTGWIETALQNSSASAAYMFFQLGGTTVFRQDTYFELPGMRLMVAPECSGIHSTLALFITSLLAGYFFLRSPGKRTLLALAVIPLAILRNGFRVFVIGELCVRIGPEMIDSYIHRHGGPIFFIMSLVPFFLILWLLVRSERTQSKQTVTTTA
jgi:exosortase C (VPDSG-CTERM-specific)